MTQHREVETKLIAAPSFELASLDGSLEGATLQVRATEDLVVVAELHTIRTGVVFRDDGGNALVEVVHDQVAASRGQERLRSWEEVEVEAVDSDEALGPPEVVVPALGAHPTVSDTLHHALARSVAQVLHHDPLLRVGGDPEDLHQLRVAIRRLRSDLHTFRDLLTPAQVDHLRRELRWVADETNELRDRDVLRAWLEVRGSSLPAADQPGVHHLVERADSEAARCRARVDEVLASPRYLELVHELVALVSQPPALGRKTSRQARRRLDAQVGKRWNRLETRVEALGANPGDRELHKARIAAKRCRAAVEAVRPLEGRAARRLAKSLAALQDVLGAVHDAAVFDSWLRAVDDPALRFTAGQLAVLARTDAHEQAARWPEVWERCRRRHRDMTP
jgi:CHAD domain-containing protein